MSAASNLLDQWQALARQYSNAWGELARGANEPAAMAADLAHGFEQWSRLFSAGSGPQGESIERMLDGAKRYAAFAQSILGAMGNQPGTAPDWGAAVLRGMAPDIGGVADAASRMFGAGPAPGDIRAWMNLPTFGPAREHQEEYQKSVLAWMDYQEQLRRYNELMVRAARRGFELFEGKLAEREQPGRQIDSLRALYDLWVDAAEEGYAEIALSHEFREVYGALVNAQMRVRAHVQKEVERVANDLGMPTRAEVDSIGQRLQALRREFRERGSDAAGDLAREVDRLRREVAELKAASEAADAPATPPSSRRVRKPARPSGRGTAKAAAQPRKPGAATKRPARRTAVRGPAKKRVVAARAEGSFASRIARFNDTSRVAPPTGALRGARPRARRGASR